MIKVRVSLTCYDKKLDYCLVEKIMIEEGGGIADASRK